MSQPDRRCGWGGVASLTVVALLVLPDLAEAQHQGSGHGTSAITLSAVVVDVTPSRDAQAGLASAVRLGESVRVQSGLAQIRVATVPDDRRQRIATINFLAN